jgi:hypothetical protein
MRVKIVVLALLLAALASGCGGNSSSSRAAASPKPTLSHAEAQIAYIRALENKYPTDFGTVPTKTLTSLANSICSAWGRGVHWTQMVKVAIGTYTVDETNYLIREATTYLCPKYESRLP